LFDCSVFFLSCSKEVSQADLSSGNIAPVFPLCHAFGTLLLHVFSGFFFFPSPFVGDHGILLTLSVDLSLHPHFFFPQGQFPPQPACFLSTTVFVRRFFVGPSLWTRPFCAPPPIWFTLLGPPSTRFFPSSAASPPPPGFFPPNLACPPLIPNSTTFHEQKLFFFPVFVIQLPQKILPGSSPFVRRCAPLYFFFPRPLSGEIFPPLFSSKRAGSIGPPVFPPVSFDRFVFCRLDTINLLPKQVVPPFAPC